MPFQVKAQSEAPRSAAPLTETSFEVSPIPSKEKFHIYLLMGQSNMAGRDRSQLDTQVNTPRVLALNDQGHWVEARDPIHTQIGSVAPGTGPGISFAREMIKADPEVTIGLIPCAVGGSPLKRWEKGGDLYKIAITRAKAASQTGTIKGILWHQGETDTGVLSAAESYETRLSQTIQNIRADLAQPELDVVVGQLGEFLALSPGKYPGYEAVQKALKDLPNVLPNVGYADSAGLGHKGDKLHFDADAANELGSRYARAMLQLQGPPSRE